MISLHLRASTWPLVAALVAYSTSTTAFSYGFVTASSDGGGPFSGNHRGGESSTTPSCSKTTTFASSGGHFGGSHRGGESSTTYPSSQTKLSASSSSTTSNSSWVTKEQTEAYLGIANKVPFRKEAEDTLLSEILLSPSKSKSSSTSSSKAKRRIIRILDLGCGDGHLLSLVINHINKKYNKNDNKGATGDGSCRDESATDFDIYGIGLDFSPPMLSKARSRFSNEIKEGRIAIVEHNMDNALPSPKDLLFKLPAFMANATQQEDGDDISTYFDIVVSSFAIHHCTHERKKSLYKEIYQMLDPSKNGESIFCNLEHVASFSPYVHQRFVDEMPDEKEDPDNKLLDVESQLNWLRQIGFDDADCYFKWREIALLIGRRRSTEDH